MAENNFVNALILFVRARYWSHTPDCHVRLVVCNRLRGKSNIHQIPTYNEKEIKSRINKLWRFH